MPILHNVGAFHFPVEGTNGRILKANRVGTGVTSILIGRGPKWKNLVTFFGEVVLVTS